MIWDIWGQSKNTVNLASSVGLFLSIFTLTPNIPRVVFVLRKWVNQCRYFPVFHSPAVVQ